MKDTASSDKVELLDNNLTKGGHILHEQEYNTGHGVSAILNEIHGEIRRQPCQPEVQQESVVHLLLEGPLGRYSAVPGLPVQAAPRPSQPAHTGGAEADPGHASPQPKPGYGGAVVSPAAERLYPPPRESVPGHAQTRAVPCTREEESIQAQTV